MINILNGTLLGNAFLRKEGRYVFKQCQSNKDYVEHVRLALKPWSTHLAFDGTYYFYTITNPIFKSLREKWYKNGKKIVPKDLTLNPEILTYWFMDKGTNKSSRRLISFSVGKLVQEDVELLIDKLKNLEIKATRQKCGLVISCKHYFKLIDLISPHVVDCMKKKLPEAIKQKWTSGKLSHLKAKEIRIKYLRGNMKQRELAEEYGVSLTTIQRVINEKIYPEANVGLRGSADATIILRYQS